jgi:hypothetical protein
MNGGGCGGDLCGEGYGEDLEVGGGGWAIERLSDGGGFDPQNRTSSCIGSISVGGWKWMVGTIVGTYRVRGMLRTCR